MELEHSFTVPAGIDEAWTTLLDVKRIAPCMPGFTLTGVNGDEVSGTVRVKVGPIVINYNGQAVFRERDETGHTVVIEASGKESRAAGTANATVYAALHAESANSTRVAIRTQLTVTGRPARFGRGIMNDVAAKLIGQFADSLAAEMTASNDPKDAAADARAESPAGDGGTGTAAGDAGSAAPSASTASASSPQRGPEAINLVQTIAVPALKRAGLAVIGLLTALLFWRKGRRRQRVQD